MPKRFAKMVRKFICRSFTLLLDVISVEEFVPYFASPPLFGQQREPHNRLSMIQYNIEGSLLCKIHIHAHTPKHEWLYWENVIT